MKQNYKNYFKRTLAAHIGLIGSQLIFLYLGITTIASTLFAIVFAETIMFGIYLLIFGIKRKDGTRKRFKKITKMMKSLGYENL